MKTFKYYDDNMNELKTNSELVKSYLQDIYIPPSYDPVTIYHPKSKVRQRVKDIKKRDQYIYNKKYIDKSVKEQI